MEQTDKAKNKQRPGTIAGLGILPPFLLTLAPVRVQMRNLAVFNQNCQFVIFSSLSKMIRSLRSFNLLWPLEVLASSWLSGHLIKPSSYRQIEAEIECDNDT